MLNLEHLLLIIECREEMVPTKTNCSLHLRTYILIHFLVVCLIFNNEELLYVWYMCDKIDKFWWSTLVYAVGELSRWFILCYIFPMRCGAWRLTRSTRTTTRVSYNKIPKIVVIWYNKRSIQSISLSKAFIIHRKNT